MSGSYLERCVGWGAVRERQDLQDFLDSSGRAGEQQLLRRPADSEWATTRSTSNDQSILPPHCAAITCVLVAAGKKSAKGCVLYVSWVYNSPSVLIITIVIITDTLAKRCSQLKPTRAKSQNQNLHQRVAKRYCQVKPACKKPFNCLNTTA